MPILRFNTYRSVLVVSTISAQVTAISIGGAKLGELLAFLLVPILAFQKKIIVSRSLIYFVAASCALFLLALFSNLNQDFFAPTGISLLKKPYWISLSRFASLCACMALVYAVSLGSQISSRLPRDFLQIQAYICVLFAAFWLASYAQIGSYFVYGNHRLRGLYNEGGPYGLMIASFICLSLHYHLPRKITFIFFVNLIASQSKAGVVLVLLFVCLQVIAKSGKYLKAASVIAACAVFAIGVSKIGQRYYTEIRQAEQLLAVKSNDNNFVMGRIAASFIAPRILIQNPVIGVGLGNYSLVRNDPNYRGPFPVVDDWDLPGLGGWATLLVESGFFGIVLFLPVFLLRYIESKNSLIPLLVAAGTFLFGVQLYFAYPWIIYAISSRSSMTESNAHFNKNPA